MLIDGREEFLYRAALAGNIDAAIKLYNEYQEDAERFDDAAHIYQNVLILHDPITSARILLNDQCPESFTKEYCEYEYLSAVMIIARNLGSNNDGFLAVHWAKKGLDFHQRFENDYGDYLKPKLDEVLQKLDWIFRKYESFFDQHYYETCAVFQWEKEYFKNRV